MANWTNLEAAIANTIKTITSAVAKSTTGQIAVKI